MAIFYPDKAAQALMDAACIGDRAAAKKHKVAQRTIRHWRQRLDEDPEFAALCLEKRILQDEAWANEIPAALAAAIQFIANAAAQLDPKDPKAVEAIAHAIEVLSDVQFTRQVVAARLAGLHPEFSEGG